MSKKASAIKFTNQQKLEVISKPFISIADIQVICDCSYSCALRRKKEFLLLCDEPMKQVGLKINTQMFLNTMQIDVKRIENYAAYEREGII